MPEVRVYKMDKKTLAKVKVVLEEADKAVLKLKRKGSQELETIT